MKVTVCFNDVKVIVPCGSTMPQSNSFLNPSGFKMIDATASENETTSMSTSSTCSSIHSILKMDSNSSGNSGYQVKVSAVAESAISRFKKATGRSQNCVINVIQLQTLRDGGILDPDDYIQDVVEDKEILIAIYEELNYESLLLKTEHLTDSKLSNLKGNISNSLNNSSLSTTSSTASTNSSLLNQVNNNNNNLPTKTTHLLHENEKLTNSEQFYTNNNNINFFTNNNTNTLNLSYQKELYSQTSANLKKSGSESCIFNETNNTITTVPNSLTMSAIAQESTTKTQYFNRVNSNRQSMAKNTENNSTVWSTSDPSSMQSSPTHNRQDDIIEFTLNEYRSRTDCQALGIHVVPSYDSSSQCDMGLVIQRIEPNARIALDGRMRPGDRLIEINKTSLIGADFVKAQEILREAIKFSNQTANGRLDFKLVRSRDEVLLNERSIEAEPSNYAYHDDHELQYEINRQNSIDPENKENTLDFNTSHSQGKDNSSFQNNNPSSVNMSALNTKKLGKKIVVQLTKGPQGLGFKLSARDNCSHHEFSPIYIKNILPKGAAITDARLQRGDRLLEVNGQNMTQMTLTDAVNILRNTKLGSCVEIIVSRQVMSGGENITECNNGNLPREISPDRGMDTAENIKSEQDASLTPRRQLLTFEIALNDTGSAGLGVSVKGKTKRIEENDCSIDLGIFIKTVINGGAASKDGQLKANDQLININGYSLLGKSNEEAMLILREAMQVESRPGHIQLTVSRKTRNQDNKSSQQVASSSPVRQQVVKVIQHGSPATKPNRFARDAPSRRSMSEKRTKIGQSHTASTISRLNSRNNNTTDSESTQPKRSKTTDPINGESMPVYNSKTLHRNFKAANGDGVVEAASKKGVVRPIHRQQENNLNQDSTSSIATSSTGTIPTLDAASNITTYHNEEVKQQQPVAMAATSRRSISMESIPNIALQNASHAHPIAESTQSINFNKYGTIGGYSVMKNNAARDDYVNVEPRDLNAQGSQRFRSINRSFRTAVDKSFDMPNLSDASSSNTFKNRRVANENIHKNPTIVQDEDKSSSEKLVHKKGLISTFQKLFKSSGKKNTPLNNKQHPTTTNDPYIMMSRSETRASNVLQPKQPQTDIIYSQPKASIHKPANNNNHLNDLVPQHYQQLETMIDNNTLYTQYKPSSSTTNHNEPNLISTSSASSTSTVSCSSTSSSTSSYNGKPYFANRDSLFYHSTDNYRYNVPILNSTEQQTFRDKQKKILEQQHLNQNQAFQARASFNQHIKHSAPVNVSNQVHTICDMFENTEIINNDKSFTRYGRNQLSTKSNPSESTASNLPIQKPSFPNDQNTIIEDEYFHRSFKTNFNQNFQQQAAKFHLQTPIILPHPAQV